jgi:hypothetical protein
VALLRRVRAPGVAPAPQAALVVASTRIR